MSLHSTYRLLDAKTTAGVTVAKFQVQHLGEPHVEDLGEELVVLADTVGRGNLCLDLADVESVTSVGLGKLVGLHKRVQAAGGHLTLYNVAPLVHEVFEVTRLTSVLDVRRRGQEAGAA
jgi:anti-anti-sigma factor